MKSLSDAKLEIFEDAAIEGAKRLKAYLVYEGDQPRYKDKAKVGAAAVGAYARIRASETNRMAVELAAQRMLGQDDLPKLSRGK